MKKFKNIILKPGFFTLAEPGEKVYGTDLGRFVRDIMNQCGYLCHSCNEDPCFEKNPLSPLFLLEKKIEVLEAKIAELEANQ